MVSVTLPPLGDQFINAETAHAAYQRILPLEGENPTLIRLLGRMLIHAPNEHGRADVARSINLCGTNEDIIKLGDYYLRYFVNYFKSFANKPTPSPSNHPSRPSMDALRDDILNSIEQAPINHSQAKNRALIRDNYRCQLTGIVDIKSYLDSDWLKNEVASDPALELESTQCSHILPQYISHDVQSQNDRCVTSATIWSIVESFGGIPQEEVNGDGIHRLRNIMTLQNSVHAAFDKLWIWLEPVEGQEHTYTVGRRNPRIHSRIPPTVTFETNSGLELPDRRYLALHAACAQVIHMSGAAELIDSILRDLEDTKVLSQDGSSAELLDYLFFEGSLMVS